MKGSLDTDMREISIEALAGRKWTGAAYAIQVYEGQAYVAAWTENDGSGPCGSRLAVPSGDIPDECGCIPWGKVKPPSEHPECGGSAYAALARLAGDGYGEPAAAYRIKADEFLSLAGVLRDGSYVFLFQ